MKVPSKTFMKKSESIPPPSEVKPDHQLIEQIQQLDLYHDYEKAFVEATGLPLRLAATGGARMTACDKHHTNPFCELLTGQNKACEFCSRFRQNLTLKQEFEHQTSICFAGLCESSVPIRSGTKIIGYLLTGEVAIDIPTPERFAKMLRKLREWEVAFDESHLHNTYFSTRVMSPEQYRSILELLTIFAGHLSLIADQLILRSENSEAPDISRAREFIKDHLTEPLDLKQVAGRANLSSCYFCKKFKESTGLTFTNYLSRTRVEAAKELLVNPQTRISEVAFEVGFQSLTHFNRVFKEVSGQSPTQYRKQFPKTSSIPRDRQQP
jgi:AraC-like DNA-binding protein/ligand-binding sensor protein